MQLKVFRYSLLSVLSHSGIVWKAERGTLNRGWMKRFVELDGDEVRVPCPQYVRRDFTCPLICSCQLCSFATTRMQTQFWRLNTR